MATKKQDADAKRAADLVGDDDMPSGHNSQTVAAQQLRSFIERLERMDEEKKVITDDRKEIMAEAKGNGFDTKAITAIIKMRKQDAAERQEAEAIVDLYKSALGME